MKRVLLLVGGIALPLVGLAAWRIARAPLEPSHPAFAKVVAIAPAEGHFHVDRNSVFVRNTDGFGEFSIIDAELHCRVGDRVIVQQQGATLTRLPSTCR